MLFVLIAALAAGILCGKFLFSPDIITIMDKIVSIALNVCILSVGIDIGFNKGIFKKIREYNIKILLIPLSVMVGSIFSGIIAGLFFNMSPAVSGALSSGFGWYTLSSVLVRDAAGAEMGAIAFLINVFRELLAFLVIPLVAKWLNKYAAVAAGGATAMDTTLPMISKSTDKETTVISVISGLILSTSVPILVPAFLNFLK